MKVNVRLNPWPKFWMSFLLFEAIKDLSRGE
jgi:hypothetical protein